MVGENTLVFYEKAENGIDRLCGEARYISEQQSLRFGAKEISFASGTDGWPTWDTVAGGRLTCGLGG
jgi:hypothetical protein